MTLKPLTIALTAVSLLLGSALANAGPHDDKHQHNRGSKHSYAQKHDQKYVQKRHDRYDQHSAYYAKGHNSNRPYDNGHKNYNAYQPKVVHVNNGWHRGQYLPVAYQSSRYRVSDWRAYRLSAPPRGYEWRRIDNRFVQVSSNNYRIARIW